MRFYGLMAILVAAAFTWAQASPSMAGAPVVVREPQALMFLGQALARLRSSPAPITDVTLSASVNYTAGSDQESGTAKLQALGVGQSRVALSLDNGERQEIRNGPTGAWVETDGAAHAMAVHNCWVDASWFYPLLTLEAASADPTISVMLAGQKALNGETVEPLVLSRIVPHQSAAMTAEIQKLSAVDVYLDASTLLPVELDFNIHPDKDANRDIPVEIEFSDYRTVSGVLVPFHIQKFIQHSLLLDLQVSSAVVNSGLAASDFAIPATSGGQQ